ncbi:MAG: acetyl-CoA carboxylase biotin carboxylase subunit, partial [Alphaproteobacteria bacterium]
MFSKILIANRGEIACRVIKTARRMEIGTVAVYSDADRSALHVEMADEAVRIGPAAAAESYLLIDAIVAACRQSGAEAVHPGYGFLSENSKFAEALSAAGIAFIGPPIKAIEVMGDKIASKKFAENAGVNIVPGYNGVIADTAQAVSVAEDIGYPVMIKASAGGGGKGMRVARSRAEAEEGFGLAQSEARSSFGDDRIFVEKFIERPRHIEIQVLADSHGNVIHLNERECSIQRRNQKVIEEAPSPFLDAQTRSAMGAQAVALAKAVDYRSAGTVEFIVDPDHNFYFLEMNTRLQVEHPVSELITGIDLVEQMIRVAAGEELTIRQQDIGIAGWAVEARIYAEDPFREFLPSTGRLTRYRPPVEQVLDGITVRNDTGVGAGSDISRYYDPMIAKLCTHSAGNGPGARDQAIAAMADALDRFTIDGVRHNIPFLSALMAHPRWQAGDLSTAFIEEEYADGFTGTSPTETERNILCAIAASVELTERDRLDRLTGRLAPHSGRMPADWYLDISNGDAVAVSIAGGTVGCPFDAELAIDGREPARVVTAWQPGNCLWQGIIDGADVAAQVRRTGHKVSVSRRGSTIIARLLTPRVGELEALMPEIVEPDRSHLLLCPMPGLVVSLAVKEGQTVQAGEMLATIEAMKMENVLRADRKATIAKINVAPGDSLAVD